MSLEEIKALEKQAKELAAANAKWYYISGKVFLYIIQLCFFLYNYLFFSFFFLLDAAASELDDI